MGSNEGGGTPPPEIGFSTVQLAQGRTSTRCSSTLQPRRSVHHRLSYSNFRTIDRLRRVSSPSAAPLTRRPLLSTGDHPSENLLPPMATPKSRRWLMPLLQAQSYHHLAEVQPWASVQISLCRSSWVHVLGCPDDMCADSSCQRTPAHHGEPTPDAG